jgi:DNA-binding CsgD family transcriptional regulator
MGTVDGVFWRAAEQVLATARLAGIDTRALVAGLPFEASTLSATRWIAWDDYCTMLERLEEACGGPEPFEQLTEKHVAFNEVKAFAAAFLSPSQLYAFLFRVVDPLCFPGVRFGYSELSHGRLRIDAELKPGLRGCLALMRGSVGALRAVPMHLGLPPAEVESELGERRSTYLVRPPASQTVFARARRRSRAALDSLTALLDEITSERIQIDAGTVSAPPLGKAPPDQALEQLRAIYGLSERQFAVLREIIAGCGNKEAASHLGCAESTVELHVTALLRKLGVHSRAQLISKCWADGAARHRRA